MWRVLAIVLALATAHAAARQAPSALPPFESATVTRSATAGGAPFISGPTAGRFTASNVALRSLVAYAYGVRDYQVRGGPEWAATARYDISATYPTASTPGDGELRLMLQALLAQRFGVVAHTEKSNVTTYELALARDDGRLGPGLARSDVDCEQEPARLASGGPVCMMLANRSFVTGGAQTMAQFAALLERYLGAAVTDRTGLKGVFDISVGWSAGGDGPVESATTDDVAALVTALPDQLGLELRPTQAALPVVVLSSARAPGEP